MEKNAAKELKRSKWRKYRPFAQAKDQRPVESIISGAQREAKLIADELVERFGAKHVILFGSLARGDFSPWSDIDIAVVGIDPSVFYRAVAFACGYSKEYKVDLVDADDCSDSLSKVIRKEGIRL